MIQRVQSLLLLAISLLLIVFLFIPIWERPVNVNGESGNVTLTAFKAQYFLNGQLQTEQSTWFVAAAAILASGVAFYSMLQFRKRLRQIKLGLLNALLMSAVLGTIFLGISKANEMIGKTEREEEFLLGFFIPIICLLLNLIANRFIRKDENLVRSADRIR